MRQLLPLPVVGFVAVLSACGGSNTVSSITNVPLTYTVGGTIAGLSGTIVLQDNGADSLSLSKNGTFAFNVAVQPNTAYSVTIATQPANQTCSVSNGSGTASGSVTSIAVVCSLSSTASDVWTWVTGAQYANAQSTYGTQGAAATTNTPGARRQSISWTDTSGNFWLFGGSGVGNVATLADLWEFTPTTGAWTWQGGSTTSGVAASYGTQGTAAAGSNPGSREGSASWTDASGTLWLFGGDSLSTAGSQVLNDLWSYGTTTGLWTWVGGSNTAGNAGSYGTLGVAAAGNLPPARTNAITWIDSSGVFWLFGGVQLNASGGYLAVYNDLWSYNPATSLWTWVGGSNTTNAPGVYGTQGIATAGNVPGARMGGNAWADSSGSVWLFGGLGLSQSASTQEYNDLWRYEPGSGLWTWISGSNAPNAAGVYGAQGSGSVGNTPGARVAASAWQDTSGNFWLFGGHGYAQLGAVGNLNDLWEYNPGPGVWIWVGGSSAASSTGTYGTRGVAATGNVPGAREQAAAWRDQNGNFWLFGGFGLDASGVNADLNDLWSLTLSP